MRFGADEDALVAMRRILAVCLILGVSCSPDRKLAVEEVKPALPGLRGAILCQGSVYVTDHPKLLRYDLKSKKWSFVANRVAGPIGCRGDVLIMKRHDDDGVTRLYELSAQGEWHRIADQPGNVNSNGTYVVVPGMERNRLYWDPVKKQWNSIQLGIRHFNSPEVSEQAINPANGEIYSCTQLSNEEYTVGSGWPVSKQSGPHDGVCREMSFTSAGLLVRHSTFMNQHSPRYTLFAEDTLEPISQIPELASHDQYVPGKRFALIFVAEGEIAGVELSGKVTSLMKTDLTVRGPIDALPGQLLAAYPPIVSGDDGVVAIYVNDKWHVIEEREGQAWPSD
jgi:hypothetical protein